MATIPLHLFIEGPFVYVYDSKAQTLTLHAPRCGRHKGGIFTRNAAAELETGKNTVTYDCTIPGSLQSNKLRPVGEDILVLPTKKAKCEPALDPMAAYFSITLPAPKAFEGIFAVEGGMNVIDESKSTIASLPLATAVRLKYSYDPTKNFALTAKAAKSFSEKLTKSPITKAAEVWIRFTDGNLNDPEMKDAKRCFKRVAKVLCLPWTLEDDGSEENPTGGHVGPTCRSPIALWMRS